MHRSERIRVFRFYAAIWLCADVAACVGALFGWIAVLAQVLGSAVLVGILAWTAVKTGGGR